MATYNKEKLSASTDGLQIKVVATATAGTLIHTATAGTTNFDEIWLEAFNSDTVPRKLTLEWGEATAPDGNIVQFIQPQSGYAVVVKGMLLQNGKTVRAFAETANVIMLNGFVNHIVP